MSQISIDRSNRLGKRNDLGQKPRAIIVKFTQYNGTHHVFGNKNLLKESTISVTENFIQKSMEHLKKAREHHGFANVWTHEYKVKVNHGNPNVQYS